MYFFMDLCNHRIGKRGEREGCSRSTGQKNAPPKNSTTKNVYFVPSCTHTDATVSYFCSSPHPFLLTFGAKKEGGAKTTNRDDMSTAKLELARQPTAALFAIDFNNAG